MSWREWRERIVERMFGDILSERVSNAVQVVDDEYWSRISGGAATLDRDWSARQEDLDDALEAWRQNPLARRIVALTTDYVVGAGIAVTSPVEWVQRFVDEFWKVNGMNERMYDWCDELTRCGELFIVLRTEAVSGMSFVRALPAVWIDRIETDADDCERERRYHQRAEGSRVAGDGYGGLDVPEGRWWMAASEETVGQEQVMLHVAINRPVGCTRGESDLQPLLPWLRRYREWLENRVRLNKYRTAFLWDVTVQGRPGQADALRQKRFRYQTPPEPGSIIVHDDAETWSAISPKIESGDASADGKAIRLMIAAGAGVPLHFLAEGESATRATAAEMGDPTYRHYYRRQLMLGQMLTGLLRLAIRRANARGRGRHGTDLKLRCRFPDITKHDNVQMAQAALLISRALEIMADNGWVDRETAITMAMKFAGELVDVQDVMGGVAGSG